MATESCFPFITWFDTDEIVGATEIEFGEKLGGTEAIEEIDR